MKSIIKIAYWCFSSTSEKLLGSENLQGKTVNDKKEYCENQSYDVAAIRALRIPVRFGSVPFH